MVYGNEISGAYGIVQMGWTRAWVLGIAINMSPLKNGFINNAALSGDACSVVEWVFHYAKIG